MACECHVPTAMRRARNHVMCSNFKHQDWGTGAGRGGGGSLLRLFITRDLGFRVLCYFYCFHDHSGYIFISLPNLLQTSLLPSVLEERE